MQFILKVIKQFFMQLFMQVIMYYADNILGHCACHHACHYADNCLGHQEKLWTCKLPIYIIVFCFYCDQQTVRKYGHFIIIKSGSQIIVQFILYVTMQIGVHCNVQVIINPVGIFYISYY